MGGYIGNVGRNGDVWREMADEGGEGGGRAEVVRIRRQRIW